MEQQVTTLKQKQSVLWNVMARTHAPKCSVILCKTNRRLIRSLSKQSYQIEFEFRQSPSLFIV